MPDTASLAQEGAAADPPDPLLGRTLAGKYRLEKKLGEGGMGAVYKARQIALEKTIAVKVMHAQLASDPMFAERFHREAKAASRLDHVNSIGILDFGAEPDGLLYIAMEFLDGRDLLGILETEAPLPAARIVDILSQALSALAVAHDMGIIHRDLKPENIMILRKKGEDERVHDVVKVCDFGIAKVADSVDVDETVPAGNKKSKLTTAGLVIGTPEYMSPEQGRGEPLDARCDLYSMGVILYLLLSGQTPFDAPTPLGIVLKHQTEEPLPPSRYRPEADLRLEGVCLKAMSKRPSDRYTTAREMRAALRGVVDGTTTDGFVAPPTRTPSGNIANARTELMAPPPTKLAASGGFLAPAPAGTAPLPIPGGQEMASGVAAHVTSGALTAPTTPRRPSSRVALIVGAAFLTVGALAGGGVYVRTLLHAESDAPVTRPGKATSTPHASPTQAPAPGPAPPAPEPTHDSLVPAPWTSPTAGLKREKQPAHLGPAPASDNGRKPLGEAVTVTQQPVAPPVVEAPVPPPTPPPVAPPPVVAPAAPAFDSSQVRVEAASATISGGGVNPRAVNTVVNAALGKITTCYRTSATASSPEGPRNLRLATDDSGSITEARVDGELPDQVKNCIAQALLRKTLPADTGAVNATVQLTFKLR